MIKKQNNINAESNGYSCKVSICIPCYKYPEDMKQLLDSIEEQTFADYEVIITDDTRDDSIKELVDSYTSIKNRIIYQKNRKQLGHIHNWNEALKKATGEYIKIMFSDDWFSGKDSLQKMVSLLDENPEAFIAFSGTEQVMRKRRGDETSIEKRERAASKTFISLLQEDYRNLFLGNEIGAPSATIYRACDVFFDEKSNWASDMFLYFDILKEHPKFAYTEEALISIGEAETQYTNMFEKYDERKFEDYQYLYQKYNLKSSEKCRQYFLEKLIMPYEKSLYTAKKNAIGVASYFTEVKKQDGRYKLEMFGNLCFWLAFFLEMLFVVLDKSSYVLKYETYDFFFTFLLFGVKILCSRYSIRQWLLLFGAAVVGIVSFLFSGRMELIRVVAFAAACSKVPVKVQLKAAFYLTGIGCLIIMFLSFLGIGYPVKKTDMYRGGGTEETRYSFGMGHPNAFHCMFLMLMLLWIAINFAKSKWYQYVIILILNIVIYLLTDSNYGFLVAMGTLGLAVILKYRADSIKIVSFLCCGVVSICMILSVVLSSVGVKYPFFRMIDHRFLNGRIQWGNQIGGPQNWSLFASETNLEYFDMGWVRVIYWYGLLPAVIIFSLIIFMVFICRKQRKVEFMIAICSLVVYTLFEAHIISVYLGRNYLILLFGVCFFEIFSDSDSMFLYKVPKIICKRC